MQVPFATMIIFLCVHCVYVYLCGGVRVFFEGALTNVKVLKFPYKAAAHTVSCHDLCVLRSGTRLGHEDEADAPMWFIEVHGQCMVTVSLEEVMCHRTYAAIRVIGMTG